MNSPLGTNKERNDKSKMWNNGAKENALRNQSRKQQRGYKNVDVCVTKSSVLGAVYTMG